MRSLSGANGKADSLVKDGEEGSPLCLRCLASTDYNLSDPTKKDALYEIKSMHHFDDLKLDRLPDETITLKLRLILERHRLGKLLFQKVNNHLKENGLILREGSIVDATIITAPSSTQNTEGERDPCMHQTKKGMLGTLA